MKIKWVIIVALSLAVLANYLISSQKTEVSKKSNLYYGYWHKDGFLEIIKE